jgi:DNA polymerase III gamma/tau subunit
VLYLFTYFSTFPLSLLFHFLQMSYQVMARKWRPQRFDDVVGQQAVTRTLRNAITSGRIAHSFVFAGPRGCGKTTTARILARALNCVTGPTADPCGVCDACVEIAQGRDIDVLEIDAASHTGIDNIREVVIAGLSITPARDRYKVFIIDEGPSALARVVQRAAQVDRGAAGARRLHDGDHRAPEDSRHDPVAVAGLRVQDDCDQGDRRASQDDSPTPRRSRCRMRRSR